MCTEVLGANGGKYIFDGLIRSTETDAKINRITTIRTRKFDPKDAEVPYETEMITILEEITKGELDGDYRWDTAEFTFVTKDGLQRFPAQRNRQRIAKSGSTPKSEQEISDQVFKVLGLK